MLLSSLSRPGNHGAKNGDSHFARDAHGGQLVSIRLSLRRAILKPETCLLTDERVFSYSEGLLARTDVYAVPELASCRKSLFRRKVKPVS